MPNKWVWIVCRVFIVALFLPMVAPAALCPRPRDKLSPSLPLNPRCPRGYNHHPVI